MVTETCSNFIYMFNWSIMKKLDLVRYYSLLQKRLYFCCHYYTALLFLLTDPQQKVHVNFTIFKPKSAIQNCCRSVSSFIFQSKYGFIFHVNCFHNRILQSITKTCLYNLTPFYIVKLGFTGIYNIFLISAQNIECGYSLEPPRRGGPNEYPNLWFEQKQEKYQNFLSENFHFLGDKIFSIFE